MQSLHVRKQQAQSLWVDVEYDVEDDIDETMLLTSSTRSWNEGWTKASASLLSLSGLQDNWDGEGAMAPIYLLIETARLLLERLPRNAPAPSRIVPSPVGSILIEWQIGKHYIEAEIDVPYRAEWMQRMPDGKITHWSTTLEELQVRAEPDYLMSGSEKAA